MTRTVLCLLVFSAFLPSALPAQDVTGDWQGSLNANSGPRAVLRVSKADCNSLTGTLYALGDDPHPIPVTSVTFANGAFSFSIDSLGISYDGRLSADSGSIHGTLHQGQSIPLDLVRATPATAWPLDPTPHKVLLVPVEKDVTLEVLDWGGTGRPVILLAGIGNTAHIFDQFAQKLTPHYHVYGITRRGFGASSSPVPWGGNYFPDRLGDDVLAVIDALHVDHPVLIGHSIAGQELSSIGSRHPEKVAGLVYLEAAHGYAFYDRVHGDALDDIAGLEREFAALPSTQDLRAEKALEQQLLTTAIPRVEQDLREELSYTKDLTAELPSSALPDLAQAPSVRQAIILGAQKFTAIHAPVLAIFALPPGAGPASGSDAAARASATQNREETLNQANAVRAGIPGSRIVLIPNASHYIFQSNETGVLREINSFIASLR